MKKCIYLSLIMLCTYYISEAQVCKISNSNDNVEVFSASIVDGSRVDVTVGNDSQDISANVTVEVTVTFESSRYSNNYSKNYVGKGVASPNQETIIKIPIDTTYPSKPDFKPTSVKVVGISGTKCL